MYCAWPAGTQQADFRSCTHSEAVPIACSHTNERAHVNAPRLGGHWPTACARVDMRSLRTARRAERYLLPARSAVYSKRPIADWLAENVERLSKKDGALFSCVHEAGDVIFVPKGMAHGVLNLAGWLF